MKIKDAFVDSDYRGKCKECIHFLPCWQMHHEEYSDSLEDFGERNMAFTSNGIDVVPCQYFELKPPALITHISRR